MDLWTYSLEQHNINILRPRQDGCHFPDDIFERIFLIENCILMKISLKFVPRDPINHIPEFVQVMAWCQSAAIHGELIDAYMRHSASVKGNKTYSESIQ